MIAMRNSHNALAAPAAAFHPDGSVNLDIIPSYAAFLHTNGVIGVFVNGTTGEGLSLTVEERMAIAERWVKAAPRNFKVIVHVSHTCAASAWEMARHATQLSARGIGEMAPIYYKPDNVRELANLEIWVTYAVFPASSISRPP
jgi:N-acetylneuraminate lyase